MGMPSSVTFPSIHDKSVKPANQGGVFARGGFDFQDHVAASFCLDMLDDASLKKVCCETHDDIILVWDMGLNDRIEFVQVKAIDLGQLWSVAKLCEREKATPAGSKNSIPVDGSSIIEKSLGNDRFSEEAWFRIVTSQAVNKDLKILTLPLTAPDRCNPNSDINQLLQDIESKFSNIRSPKGNNCEFWISRMIWNVEHTIDAIRRKNLEKLSIYVESQGEYLLYSNVQEIYDKILRKVQDAANAQWDIEPDTKNIERQEFLSWIQTVIRESQMPATSSAGQKMQQKMESAGIPDDYIANAHEERRFYLKEIFHPKYLDLSDQNLAQGEVCSELVQLRLKMDTAELSDGFEFYKACRDKMEEIRANLQTKTTIPLFFLNGCMYNIVDRCLHRYQKAML